MRASAIVKHGANFAERVADNVAVVQPQRSILHKNCRHRAAPAIELGFDDRTNRLASRRRLGCANIRDEADHFQKQVEILALLGGDFDEDGALIAGARPLFGNQAAIRKLLLHAVRIRFRFVDLVDGHDDRNIGRLRVVNGFKCLRHHAIVGGHHDHNDVRDLGAARSHARKRFVARRIEEDNLASRGGRALLGELHLVGADVLRDAAGLASRNIGFADRVEQRSLAVIDVAHDGDHRRTRNFQLARVLRFENFFDGLVGNLFFVADHGCRRAELGGDVLDHLGVERLVHRNEHSGHQECRDQVLGAHLELLGQVLDADAFGDRDLARDGQRLSAILHPAITWRRHKALHWAFLRLGILLLTSAGAFGGSALRTRRFTRRRCSACARTGSKSGTRRSAKAGTCTESRTRSWTARYRQDLHSRPAWCVWGVLAVGRRGTVLARPEQPRCPLRIASRTAGGPAIENRLAPLDARARSLISSSHLSRDRRQDGSLVHGARASLRHYHAANRRGRRCNWRGFLALRRCLCRSSISARDSSRRGGNSASLGSYYWFLSVACCRS